MLIVPEISFMDDNFHEKIYYNDAKNTGKNQILGGQVWAGVFGIDRIIGIIGSSATTQPEDSRIKNGAFRSRLGRSNQLDFKSGFVEVSNTLFKEQCIERKGTYNYTWTPAQCNPSALLAYYGSFLMFWVDAAQF